MTFVGIDVSKHWLDVCSEPTSVIHYVNTLDGIANLITELPATQLVVVEATGGYERLVVCELLKANLPVYVANPKRLETLPVQKAC
jgi:transposase